MKAAWAWLFDIGSTFTKLTVVDVNDPTRRYRTQSPTTIAEDVRTGFLRAVTQVEGSGGPAYRDAAFRSASSSAAGGLKLVVSGLVPRLSAEAGRIAALGAGAKLLHSFSYRLTPSDVEAIARLGPDIILLTGGTDGGDTQTLLANARALSTCRTCPTVIVAGNREASDEAVSILSDAGITNRAVDNILPELKRLVPEPTRAAIRGEFLANITRAKGIDRVRAELDADLLPTPLAVLQAVQHLSEHAFAGGVMAFEVGGATTNVHSCSTATVSESVILRGLPEPSLRRTVEGDLGVRWNAETIFRQAGNDWFEERGANGVELAAYLGRVVSDPFSLPRDRPERQFDALLATFAGRTAITRHCGRHREVMLPQGPAIVQEGKDLRHIEVVIGTGGAVAWADNPTAIIENALDADDPFTLTPTRPRLLVDHEYVLYAVGLLSEYRPDAALELAKHSFGVVSKDPHLEQASERSSGLLSVRH